MSPQWIPAFAGMTDGGTITLGERGYELCLQRLYAAEK